MVRKQLLDVLLPPPGCSAVLQPGSGEYNEYESLSTDKQHVGMDIAKS